MRLLLILLFCLHFILACSSGETDIGGSTETQPKMPEHLQDVENLTVLPVDSEPQFEIDLVRETNFGDKYDDVVYLGYINDFAVDDQGRVYLADMSNDRIHVYNPDGSFLQSIGRSGRGPGEFLTNRGGLDIGVNDEYLFAYDDTNFRISRFSLDTFELINIVNLDMGHWNRMEDVTAGRPFEIHFREDGTYLAGFRVRDPDISEPLRGGATTGGLMLYYLFNQDFELISEKILEYVWPPAEVVNTGGTPMLFSFPFTNRTIAAFSEAGHIYEADSEEFLVRIYGPDGSYVRSIYAPVEADPFTGEDRERLIEERESYSRGFGAISMPDQWPVLNQITVDDENRLWVSVITESQDSTEWWVLGENDRLLAKFPWPRNLLDQPGQESGDYIIKNGAMYYLESNSMNLDQQTVVKYRIEVNPKNEDVEG